METGPAKRPFCHRCSKPQRLCLCSRLKTPPLDNSIAVTVLQHSLEKHHPLNSIRVARLGLKNLATIPVTDVIFTAQFTLRPIDPTRSDSSERSNLSTALLESDRERLEFSANVDGNGECGNGYWESTLNDRLKLLKKSKQPKSLNFDHITDGAEAVFDKHRVVFSSTDLRISIERTAKPDISWVSNTPIGRALAANGFTVEKLQRKKLHGSKEFQDFIEFDIAIPPGAALLFPNGDWAIGLNEVDFEVKHLIVLDGTWAKAQRMYHENPWLRLLPHLKVDPGKESLYSEVRHEPKAGCLSTVESIVYALKGLGNDMEGLDELLEVFKSMIGDQRRCKDENFKAKSTV